MNVPNTTDYDNTTDDYNNSLSIKITCTDSEFEFDIYTIFITNITMWFIVFTFN